MSQKQVYPEELKNWCPICERQTVKKLLPEQYQRDPERVSYMCDDCVQGINFLKNGRYFN